MQKADAQVLTTHLAEDLGWLEQHCRKQPEQVVHAAALRMAASLVRNCIGPALEEGTIAPLHVAVVGGAGAGKSTIVNMLAGTTLAEANPQAGFTRHPIAYFARNGVLTWPSRPGFLGPLQRLSEPCPSNLDEDVYQIRHVQPDPVSESLLRDVVIWDCPDMTTWAATGYIPRLLEIAGLADLLVYVASDERYNDEVPTQFLQLLLQTGKPVICCLTKMHENQAPILLEHFQKEVLGKLPRGTVACVAVPYLTPAQVGDPVNQATRYRIPLMNQIAVFVNSPAECRRRTLRGAVGYLTAATESLLASARKDVAALDFWRHMVRSGQAEFEQRYRREYLTGERFRAFDQALVRLLELLDVPGGVGRVVSGTLHVVRTPYRLVRGWVDKTFQRPLGRSLPERQVLEESLGGWLNSLRKEVVHKGDQHPLWRHLQEGFTGPLPERLKGRFEECFKAFETSLADEIERTARNIYQELEKKPVVLNTLRGTKLTMDVGLIGGAIFFQGVNPMDLVLVPLAASVSQYLAEAVGKQHVDNQREQARQRQQALITQAIAAPLGDWLTAWPTTGGTAYERLQLALTRIPGAIKQLQTTLGTT